MLRKDRNVQQLKQLKNVRKSDNDGSITELCSRFACYLEERNSLEKRIKCGGNGKRCSHQIKRLEQLTKVLIPRTEDVIYNHT